MSSESDGDAWSYASVTTTARALQRGLGRGALGAMLDPAGPELVADCLRRDYRWDWQVDEREVYLARLVRDLRLPVAGVTARLFTAPGEGSDDGHRFELTVGVVEALGRAGVDEAVEEIRRCVQEGERWLDVLHTVAASWPPTWWEDLLPAVLGRLDAAAERDVLWLSAPWPRWALHDRRIAKAVEAANSRPRPSRPFADTPTDALLAILRGPAGADDRRLVLWELRRRLPQPELLPVGGCWRHMATPPMYRRCWPAGSGWMPALTTGAAMTNWLQDWPGLADQRWSAPYLASGDCGPAPTPTNDPATCAR
ncbi:MAG TPA: hypothetical protein VFP72_08935 [Kineosporiaceae bacterium]|nr:hypothetical protein [Kineosporiaceae bacterium]